MSYSKRKVGINPWPEPEPEPEKEKEKDKFRNNKHFLKLTLLPALLLFSITLLFLVIFYTSWRISQSREFPASLSRTCDLNFTVYVYDLPPEFNIHLLNNCRHLNIYADMCPHVANNGFGQPLHINTESNENSVWFATHQFLAEMIFHARVKNHPCRTWEPNRADILYVPFYGGLYASSVFREYNLTKRDELAIRLMDYISNKKWWRKTNGGDHFLAFGRTAWDFMRTSDGPDFGANILMQLPRVMNMSVLTVERQPWKGFNQFGIPYPSYFHPRTSLEMVTWQRKMKRAQRPYLFCFVGGVRKGLEKAAIRDELIRQCAESTRCDLLKCQSGGTKCHEPMTVLEVMSRSRFCLQAPGDSFTRRSTFDAILAGCIPVFFSPHTMYTQYKWYLPENITSYSVFMDQNNNTHIEKMLSRIKENEVNEMRETVIGLIPRLTYAHPNATAYRLQDAVDVALEALAKQVKAKLGHSL